MGRFLDRNSTEGPQPTTNNMALGPFKNDMFSGWFVPGCIAEKEKAFDALIFPDLTLAAVKL